jgi:ATP-dependent helicase Lhr and Lhr-like helicase
MMQAVQEGERVLLFAPTGGDEAPVKVLKSPVELSQNPPGLYIHSVSPLKAMRTEITRNLMRPVAEMTFTAETRTDDTPANRHAHQRATPPQLLLTRPENRAALISHHIPARCLRARNSSIWIRCMRCCYQAGRLGCC